MHSITCGWCIPSIKLHKLNIFFDIKETVFNLRMTDRWKCEQSIKISNQRKIVHDTHKQKQYLSHNIIFGIDLNLNLINMKKRMNSNQSIVYKTHFPHMCLDICIFITLAHMSSNFLPCKILKGWTELEVTTIRSSSRQRTNNFCYHIHKYSSFNMIRNMHFIANLIQSQSSAYYSSKTKQSSSTTQQNWTSWSNLPQKKQKRGRLLNYNSNHTYICLLKRNPNYGTVFSFFS